jgi:hypothetical protein
MDGLSARDVRHWDQVAAVELRAVAGNGVDLIGAIGSPEQTLGSATARVHANQDGSVLQWRPFALDSESVARKVEQEVITTVLCHWLEDVDP